MSFVGRRLVLDLDGAETVFFPPGKDAAYPWLIGTGPLNLAATAGHLEGIGVGETASVEVRIKNERNQASRLIGYAMRAAATLYDDEDNSYIVGLVQQIVYGNPLVLTIEAGGGSLLDSEPLPLRSTRALGDYAEDVPLPWLFGDFTSAPFPLIRLSPTRYFVADHPAEVTKVFIGKQQHFGWSAGLESDTDGHTWTVATFTSAIAQDAEVSACGRGKRDDDTGELIENGADVERAVYKIAGRDVDRSELRAECSALDLRIAVRVSERSSIKVAGDAVTQSFGAISWHGGARLYPAAISGPVFDLYPHEARGLTITANSQDTADVLRLSYDRSDASDRNLHYIELSASPQRFGGLAKEVSYPSLRTPANAEAIGRAVLKRLAGQRYGVTFDSTNRNILPGMWVRPVANPEWTIDDDEPVLMVLQAAIEDDNGSRAITAETIIGDCEVTVTAHSIALPDTVAAAVDVSVQDGVATFTFTDADGRPIAGAHVSLDGGQAKTTDAQGKVRFPVNVVADKPVDHELAFEAPGFAPFSVVVPL